MRLCFVMSAIVVSLSVTACGIQDMRTTEAQPTAAQVVSAPTAIPPTRPTSTPSPITTPTNSPTPTRLPPTSTPTTVIATLLPATPTIIPAADVYLGIKQTIRAAMQHTRSATVFQLEKQIIGKGGLENIFFYMGISDPQQEGAIDDTKIMCNGDNCASHLKGASAGMFGSDPQRGFENITFNGDAYYRGPIGILDLMEDRWYLRPGEINPLAVSILPSEGLYGDVDEDNGKHLSAFAYAGQETLDGIQCNIFTTTDKELSLRVLRKTVGYNMLISNVSSFEGDGTTEFKIWTCADGYFHQMWLRFVGHDNTRPDTEVERSYRLRIFGYDEQIVITPPADAIVITPTPSAP